MNRIARFAHKAFSTQVRQRIQQERLSRLNKSSESLPLQSSSVLSLYRNVATIAHIDAGKTTLTERMLYLSGAIPWLGEVHHGTALMDFMEEERKRGITISSASITFSWKNTHINLIDTPGHADFNFEVERSLKVLDGAVLIIDGVKGVEAQTETVWRQADKYNLAKLLVINKMDRPGAEYERCIRNVEEVIGTKVLPAYFPLLNGELFEGIVDIFGGKLYFWRDPQSDGLPGASETPNSEEPARDGSPAESRSGARQIPLSENYALFEETLDLAALSPQNRKAYTASIERMVEIVGEIHEGVTDEYLTSLQPDGITVRGEFLDKLKVLCKQLAHQHRKKYCISVPCSALKNKGVHCVLDSVLEYLPPPTDNFPDAVDPFVFVFKTVADPAFGLVAFIKIMAGKLSRGQQLFNSNALTESKVARIFRIRANEYAEIESAGAGDIVAVTGLAGLAAGDNLTPQAAFAGYQPHLVKGFEPREPVFHASLEFERNADKEVFDKLIVNYLLEDPSLRYKFDAQTGQFVLSGLGELQIETKLARLRNEHGLRVAVGKVAVAFKEMVGQAVTKTTTLKRELRGALKFFELTLQIEPIDFEDGEETQPSVVEIRLFDHFEDARNLYEQYAEVMSKTPQSQASQKATKARQEPRQPELMPLAALHPREAPKPREHTFAKLSFIENPVRQKVSTRKYFFTPEHSDSLYHIHSLEFEHIYAIQKMLEEMALTGPLTFSSLVNTRISVVDGQFNRDYFDPIVLKMATVNAFQETLARERVALLEPMVEAHITVKNTFVNEIMNNAVSKRSGRMGVIEEVGTKDTTFTVDIPLLASANYAAYLRSVTSGDAKFTIRNKNYARVKPQRQQLLCEKY